MGKAVIQVTKAGQSGELSIFTGKERKWWIKPWIWGAANSGSWRTFNTGGRGSHPTQYVSLDDWSGNQIYTLPFLTGWSAGAKFQAHLGSPLVGDPLDAVVQKGFGTKHFRICVTGQGGMSYGVGQMEVITLDLEDSEEKTTVSYTYSGKGLSLGVPGPKGLGNIARVVRGGMNVGSKGGVSTSGPWNDFDAPGWMTAYDFGGHAFAGSPYSLGMGSDTSWNTFSFGQDGGSYLVNLTSFSTGQTFSLPSVGGTTGDMQITDNTPHVPTR